MNIENEIQKFNVSEAAITELSKQYMPLMINGVEDKNGYKIVKAARLVVKAYRVDVDKMRKELNADALAMQRGVNEEAKRITAMLSPIEDHLSMQEKVFDQEVARIKQEKIEKERVRIQDRVKRLMDIDFKFDGFYYQATYLSSVPNQLVEFLVPSTSINSHTDDEFDALITESTKAYEKHLLISYALEREKEDAIGKQQAHLKAEQERLDQQRKELEELMNNLDAAKGIPDAGEITHIKNKEKFAVPIIPGSLGEFKNMQRPPLLSRLNFALKEDSFHIPYQDISSAIHIKLDPEWLKKYFPDLAENKYCFVMEYLERHIEPEIISMISRAIRMEEIKS